MTINDVQQWCREHTVDARAILRGADFSVRHDAPEGAAPPPPIQQVFHWELIVEGRKCPTSSSDMERLVTGKMALDDFVRRLRAYYDPEKA